MRLTVNVDLLRSNTSSLVSLNLGQEIHTEDKSECVVEMREGDHFGEWALLGESINSVAAVAIGHAVCAVITKEKFDSAVGPLAKLLQDEQRYLVF